MNVSNPVRKINFPTALNHCTQRLGSQVMNGKERYDWSGMGPGSSFHTEVLTKCYILPNPKKIRIPVHTLQCPVHQEFQTRFISQHYSKNLFASGSSGMAYLSGMCSQQASCTIAEARSLGSTALIGTRLHRYSYCIDYTTSQLQVSQGPGSTDIVIVQITPHHSYRSPTGQAAKYLYIYIYITSYHSYRSNRERATQIYLYVYYSRKQLKKIWVSHGPGCTYIFKLLYITATGLIGTSLHRKFDKLLHITAAGLMQSRLLKCIYCPGGRQPRLLLMLSM